MKLTKKDIIGGKRTFKWCDSGEPNTHGEELLNYDSDIQEIIWRVCSKINIPEDELEYSVAFSTKLIELSKLHEVIASIETDTQDCFTGLTKDDDWQKGARFMLKLLKERIGEVIENV